ncbi:uncharacterized protein TRIVIDRAFT_62340 [Trichoderma virens Gv29-8]|uniref:Heterokaryon incompatibility domain-containing protein n=1 Tax=Hypocrea virens (strain Gv29-8 / FGSC 10586) TaxID=413071 RepID=G9MJK9_HYPVG|nr:uncharacterized protein TRIVIDRAFT_62340 [Trichoderma virens Gv29-8]EHK25672.1 hypothetical protein TRIVIDRAFT_62340 [Trichoderma virens Gv29-8]
MPMRYKPLRQGRVEIRLLELVSTKDATRLCFRLHRTRIEDAPRFWALSYAWGDGKDKLPIFIDNHTFFISRSLWMILWNHIRLIEHVLEHKLDVPNYEVRYLWVDSICINQDDLEERRQQVLIMDRIYSKGIVGVFIDNDDKAVAHTIAALSSKYGSTQNGLGPPKRAYGAHPEENQISISEMEWSALHNFFSKAWFKRVWVIQEFFLSKLQDSMMQIHTLSLQHLNVYLLATRVFETHPQGLTGSQKAEMFQGIKEYMSLMELKIDLQQNLHNKRPPGIFLTLLWMFRDRLSTDPRDKIYALLGLFQSLEAEVPSSSLASPAELDINHVIVDYGAEVENVYASVVRAMVLGTQSLNILCACQTPSTLKRSWIPNWAESWQRFSLLTRNVHRHLGPPGKPQNRQFYRASASRVASATFSNDLERLTVTRICHGRIIHLIEPPPCTQLKDAPSLHWLISALDNLPANIQQLIADAYNQFHHSVDSDSGAFIDHIIADWANGMTGGLAYVDESRAYNPAYYYENMDLDWHDLARTYIRRGKDGSDEASRDLRFYQLAHKRKLFVDETGHFGLTSDFTEVGDIAKTSIQSLGKLMFITL